MEIGAVLRAASSPAGSSWTENFLCRDCWLIVVVSRVYFAITWVLVVTGRLVMKLGWLWKYRLSHSSFVNKWFELVTEFKLLWVNDYLLVLRLLARDFERFHVLTLFVDIIEGKLAIFGQQTWGIFPSCLRNLIGQFWGESTLFIRTSIWVLFVFWPPEVAIWLLLHVDLNCGFRFDPASFIFRLFE